MNETWADGLTLDQIAVFLAVVSEGSFTAAAKHMNRAQSAITYGVRNLETQIGSELFDRSSYRPVLTPTGVALLARAKRIMGDVADFRKQALSLKMGTESRLTLVCDIVTPKNLILKALSALKEKFPMIEVAIISLPLEQVFQTLRDGRADLGVVVRPAHFPAMDETNSIHLFSFRMVVVAAPNHPLAKMKGPIKEEYLWDYTQLFLSSGIEMTGTSDLGARSVNRWRITNPELRHTLLVGGLGWGAVPEYKVREDLAAGRLVALPIEPSEDFRTGLSLSLDIVYLKTKVLGPAGHWLFENIPSMVEK